MPYYVFLCLDCKKEFTQSLHMSDIDTIDIKCPTCGGMRVTQKAAAFSAVTSKKS